MAFLLDTLKKKISGGESGEGFDDLNYIVGNTSGLDIGNVPSPLDQRIGRMAQIGGGIMEIQITNPATFQIDRPELMNVINQLGFDAITLHGDPNIGFTGAYATRGQGITGYNIVHRYFKRYLEQMASFQWEASNEKGLFDVGYVNMHASNEQIPAREERLASDVSVDPFGFQVTNINGGKNPNIYKNEEFLENLFDYFFLQVVEQPWEQYERNFSNEDDEFADKWDNVKGKIADNFFRNRAKGDFEKVQGLLGTASRIDQELDREFGELIESRGNLDGEVSIRIPQGFGEEPSEENAGTLQQIRSILNQIGQDVFKTPRELGSDIGTIQQFMTNPDNLQIITDALRETLEYQWEESDVISVRAKTQSLANNLDIQETRIYENAQDRAEATNAARKAFRNIEIVKNFANDRRYSDDFNKESSLFFHIMPAWMQAADNEYENHEGWEVPKFIWESTLRQSIEESDVADDPYFDSWEKFEEFLEERRENVLDVIAAVGICYMWGHWTQNQDRFDTEAFDLTVTKFDEYEKPELKDENDEGMYTWIEWMNKFNLRLNIEAMFGSPGELRRVWRPKDIAIACHAINRQARQDLGDAYDENLVKFTIDMEHTASYGVDPWNEMEKLIENEKALADEYPELGIDKEKPLAEIVKTYHLTKPGWEQQQGHRHGPFARGDETLYYWLYNMVDAGFARNPDDEARIIFEVGGEYREEMYVTRVSMDMIEHGISPEELDVNKVPVDGEFETVEQQLIARFFGMDKGSFNREWSKIEEHAFDPLDGLLQARSFDDTFSGQGAIEQGQARPNEWKGEEYR